MRFPFEIKEIRAKNLEELNKKIKEKFSCTETIISIQKEKVGYTLLYLEYFDIES